MGCHQWAISLNSIPASDALWDVFPPSMHWLHS